MSKFKQVFLLLQFVYSLYFIKRFFQICFFSGCLTSFSQQQIKIDSLTNVLPSLNQDTNKVNVLNDLSLQILNQGIYEKAKTYIYQAKALSEKINYKKGLAASLNRLGTFYLYTNDLQQALDNYFAALKIRTQIGNKQDIANTLSNIGIVYFRILDYNNAFKYIFKGLKIREDSEDKQGIISSMIILGNLYNSGLKNYTKALECYSRGLIIEEERKNKHGVADLTILIGNTYLELKNFSKALEYYSKGLIIKENINDKNGINQILHNIATVYFNQKNFSQAREFFIKKLQVAEEIGEKQHIANSLLSIGQTYFAEKNYIQAIEYFRKAQTLFQQINCKSGEEKISFEFGNLYDSLNQNTKSFYYFNNGIEISKQIGDKEYTLLFYQSLMNYYKKVNNYLEANKFMKLYFEMKDTLLSEVKEKQIARLHIQYETEKKEKEIEVLTQRNQILKQQNKIQQLQAEQSKYIILGLIGATLMIVLISLLFIRQFKLKSLYVKSIIEQKLLRSQMNPHFIFNAMMGVQNLIYKQESEKAVKYLSSLVKLMRAILESSREEYVSLEKEMTTLEHYLILQQLRFIDKFDFSIEVNQEIDVESCLIPPMMAQPFIENSIEHGIMNKTHGKGMISVRFDLQNESLKLEIEDNGIGREKAKEIKQSHKSKHLSVATNITEERLTILNHKAKKKTLLLIKDLKNKTNEVAGTKVTFLFPMTKSF